MPQAHATSASIHVSNLNNLSANLAASSGSMNSSSANTYQGQIQGAITMINLLISESQLGHKISS